MKRNLWFYGLVLLLTLVFAQTALASSYSSSSYNGKRYGDELDFDDDDDLLDDDDYDDYDDDDDGYDGYGDFGDYDSYEIVYNEDDGFDFDDSDDESDSYTDDYDDDDFSYFDEYHAKETIGEGDIIAIDEEYELMIADEPIEFDDSYIYIIFDNPLYFEDNDIDPDPIEFPDDLAGLMVNWDYDTRVYPYKAMVRTRGGRLNLRSGPSTGASVIGHIDNGSIVLVCARSFDLNWAYVVAADGRQGFVFDSYLTTSGLHSSKSKISRHGQIYFTAEDLEGNEFTSDEIFSQFRAVMINNWATWCTYCKGELEDLERIDKEMSSYNCAIIGIVRDAVDDDTVQLASEILAEHGVTYLNLKPFDDVDELFPMEAYPTTFFVDSNGNLLGNPIEGVEIDQYIYRFYDILY